MPRKERRGRPTFFTRETRARICTALLSGNTRRAAAESAGVAVRTMEKWIARGRRNAGTEFGRFVRQVHMCEAGAELRVVDALFNKAIEGDVVACREWLKRRRRDDWGDRVTIDLDQAAQEVADAAGVPKAEVLAQAEMIAARVYGEGDA